MTIELYPPLALVLVAASSPFVSHSELARRDRLCAAAAAAAGWSVQVLPRRTRLSDAVTVPAAGGDALAAAHVVTWSLHGVVTSPADLSLCERFRDAGGRVYEARSGELVAACARQLALAASATGDSDGATLQRHAAATHDARRALARQGQWLGGRRPLGWTVTEDGTVEVDEVAALRIREATARIIDGARVGSIAAQWNAQGFTTLTGRTWTFGSVRRVLLRARNAGLSEYRGRIVGRSAWPAIVSESDWVEVRERIGS